MSKRTRIFAAAAAVSVLGTVLAITLLRNRAPEGIFASGTVEVTEADLGFQLPRRIDSMAIGGTGSFCAVGPSTTRPRIVLPRCRS